MIRDRNHRREGRAARPLLPLKQALYAFVFGSALSLVVWTIAGRWESQSLALKLERTAEVRNNIIQSTITADMDLLKDAERFFSNSDVVTKEEFRGFLGWKFTSDTSIVSVDWAPRVSDRDRAKWEREHRRTIASPGRHAAPTPRSPASVYFPV